MARPDLIPSRGAIPEEFTLEVTRELTAGDLGRLGDAPKVGVPVLQRLRATHHRQAQLLAAGKTLGEVAAIVGCTTARLTQLQTDPSFIELVTYYQDQIMSAMLNDTARLKDKLIDVGEMAVDELRDRMEDDVKRRAMPVGEVRKIAEFAMDRTVAPPVATPPAAVTPAAITINFGTSVRSDPALRSVGEFIDVTPEPAPPSAPLPSPVADQRRRGAEPAEPLEPPEPAPDPNELI